MIDPNDIEQLSESVKDLVTFYNALREFLLELRALDDARINALFNKYDVVVS